MRKISENDLGFGKIPHAALFLEEIQVTMQY